MWPFKRKKISPTIPTEVQDYYQSERRERVGVAWLLALATLVTTIVLAFGIFFGGRWGYRKFVKHTKPNTVAITKNNKPQSTSNSGSKNQDTTQAPKSSDQSGSTKSNPKSNTGSSTAPSTTPAQSRRGTNTSLTNTGPGDTVGIFFGVSAIAGLGHHLFTRRKLQVKV